MAVVAIVVLGLAVAVLATSLLRLRNRFEPLEKLIEEMEKVDLGRPGAALPHSIDGIGETEEVAPSGTPPEGQVRDHGQDFSAAT